MLDHHLTAMMCSLGMHEDARMCLSIALTAARLGASVANHVEVIELLKRTESDSGKTVVSGARVRDTQTGSCLVCGRTQYRMGVTWYSCAFVID